MISRTINSTKFNYIIENNVMVFWSLQIPLNTCLSLCTVIRYIPEQTIVVGNKPFYPIVTFLSWLSSLNLVSLASKIMGYIFFLTHSEKLLQIPPIDYCSSSTSNRWGLSVHFKIQMLFPETLKAYHNRPSYLAHYKEKDISNLVIWVYRAFLIDFYKDRHAIWM